MVLNVSLTIITSIIPSLVNWSSSCVLTTSPFVFHYVRINFLFLLSIDRFFFIFNGYHSFSFFMFNVFSSTLDGERLVCSSPLRILLLICFLHDVSAGPSESFQWCIKFFVGFFHGFRFRFLFTLSFHTFLGFCGFSYFSFRLMFVVLLGFSGHLSEIDRVSLAQFARLSFLVWHINVFSYLLHISYTRNCCYSYAVHALAFGICGML